MNPGYHEDRVILSDQESIEALWTFRPQRRMHHRVLPDGRIDLVVRFKLGADNSIYDLRSVIAGPSQQFSIVPADLDTGLMGIRFRPGWGAACLDISANEIRNKVLVGEDAVKILGKWSVLLLDVGTLKQLQQRLVKIASAMAMQGAQASGQVSHVRSLKAIALLEHSHGTQTVGSLAAETGVSVRTLRRDVSATLGLPVKSFASILRFQHTMRLARRKTSLSLTALALTGGYSDQAHMTREFRELGGFTPGAQPDVPVINLCALADSFNTAVA